jgi:hypothetical protein
MARGPGLRRVARPSLRAGGAGPALGAAPPPSHPLRRRWKTQSSAECRVVPRVGKGVLSSARGAMLGRRGRQRPRSSRAAQDGGRSGTQKEAREGCARGGLAAGRGPGVRGPGRAAGAGGAGGMIQEGQRRAEEARIPMVAWHTGSPRGAETETVDPLGGRAARHQARGRGGEVAAAEGVGRAARRVLRRRLHPSVMHAERPTEVAPCERVRQLL